MSGTGMPEAAEAADDLWARIERTVDALPTDAWSSPTPCSAWTVRDLLAHVAGLQTAVDGGPQPPPSQGWAPDPAASAVDQWTAAGVAARATWSPQQVRDELRAARAGHVARLRAADPDAATHGPTGPTTEAGLFQVRCYDLWVHLQDLRLAAGLPVDAEDSSEAALLAHRHVLRFVPWMFAKRAGAGEGATMRVRLRDPLPFDSVLEVRNGRADWNADADPGACLVDAAPAALTLLCSGRPPLLRPAPPALAEAWRHAGLLEWAGPRGDEFVERARLFA